MHADVAAGELAARQHGLITRAQAEAAGVSAGQVRWRLRTGRWRRIRHGVFAVTGSPPTWEQQVLAAVLVGGLGAVASHWTAAMLHRFPDAAPDRLEITVPPGRQPRPVGLTIHRTGLLPEHDVTRVGRIPTTSFARTLVDCTGCMSLGQIARALDDGLVRRSVTLWSVERSLRALEASPGRRPSVLWTLLAERGRETAHAESRSESRVARVLRGAGLPLPEQQHWVRLGSDRFRLDFAYPGEKVALEYDGWATHQSRRAFDSGRRRDRLLQLAGWRVIRITSRTSDDELVATIRAFVSEEA